MKIDLDLDLDCLYGFTKYLWRSAMFCKEKWTAKGGWKGQEECLDAAGLHRHTLGISVRYYFPFYRSLSRTWSSLVGRIPGSSLSHLVHRWFLYALMATICHIVPYGCLRPAMTDVKCARIDSLRLTVRGFSKGGTFGHWPRLSRTEACGYGRRSVTVGTVGGNMMRKVF